MKFILPALLSFSFGLTTAQSVVYVNSTTGNDTLNGLSSVVNTETGAGPKQTISSALALAASNDIVSIESGVYAEDITLNKTIQLVKTGEGIVSLNGLTFTANGNIDGNLPLDRAIQATNVVVQSGAEINDGYLLTAVNGNLIVQEGIYNELLIAQKDFLFTSIGNVSVSGIRMNANGGTMTLGGSLRVTSSIELNQVNGGYLELSAFDLTLGSTASINGGNATSYIKTSGTGSLYNTIASGSVTFPIGNGSSYAPLTINENGNTSELVGARVREAMNTNSFNPDLPGSVNSFVGLEWVLVEETQGGNTASIRFDYSGNNELNSWASAQNRSVYRNDGVTWTAGSNSAINQSYSSADFTSLGGFFAIYSDFPNTVNTPEGNIVSVYPNPANDFVFVSGFASALVDFEIVSLDGKSIISGKQSSNAIDVSGLPSGFYFVKLIGTNGLITIPFVKG
jgi:hypothetical protein